MLACKNNEKDILRSVVDWCEWLERCLFVSHPFFNNSFHFWNSFVGFHGNIKYLKMISRGTTCPFVPLDLQNPKNPSYNRVKSTYFEIIVFYFL